MAGLQWLFHATDPTNMGLFRLVFGLLVITEWGCRFVLNSGSPSLQTIAESQFRFKFTGFEWVPVPEGLWLKVFAWVMVFAALFLAIGRAYRLSAVVFFGCFVWQLLWDAAYYTHYSFFVAVLAFCFVVTDAHRFARVSVLLLAGREAPHNHERLLSVGRPRFYDEQALENTKRVWAVPYWQLLLFRIACLMPYLFSGLSRLNADWLAGYPAREWLGGFLSGGGLTVAALLVSYTVLAFELLFPFAVLDPRHRSTAAAACVVYHLLGALPFSGTRHVPLVHLAALLLYVDSNTWRRLIGTELVLRCPEDTIAQMIYLLPPYIDEHGWRQLCQRPNPPPRPIWVGKMNPPVNCTAAFLVAFVAVLSATPALQLLHTLTGRPPAWALTHHFAWRLPSYKHCTGEYVVTNTNTQASFRVDDYRDPLVLRNPHKDLRFKVPSFVRQYGEFLARWYSEHWGGAEVSVHARVQCSLNGAAPRAFVDESADLARQARPRWPAGEPFVLPY